MDTNRLHHFRTMIEARLTEIAQEDTDTTSDRAIVMLDQQSVGRLSRMDAMQKQAMANATHQRRQNEKLGLRAALARMESDEFGYCLDCGDEIPDQRLKFNPATPRCISCVRGLLPASSKSPQKPG